MIKNEGHILPSTVWGSGAEFPKEGTVMEKIVGTSSMLAFFSSSAWWQDGCSSSSHYIFLGSSAVKENQTLLVTPPKVLNQFAIKGKRCFDWTGLDHGLHLWSLDLLPKEGWMDVGVCVCVWRLNGLNNKFPPYISNINGATQEPQEGERAVLSNGLVLWSLAGTATL